MGGPLPLGYDMTNGKVSVVEEEAEQVRLIFRRYLELSGVNALVRDLKERNIRTKTRLLATGGTRGGIPFERGAVFAMRPPWSPMSLSRVARRSVRPLSVPTSSAPMKRL